MGFIAHKLRQQSITQLRQFPVLCFVTINHIHHQIGKAESSIRGLKLGNYKSIPFIILPDISGDVMSEPAAAIR